MDSERRQKFSRFLGRPEYNFDISFSPSTNQEILNECQSYLNSNPLSKTSAPYRLDYTIVRENSPVSNRVDLFGIDLQNPDTQWYDIFFFIHGKPARVMLQTNQGNSNAILFLVKDSDIPDFDDDRIIQWLDSIDI
tara:strand:+ start:130 stop:537 length:408 start_codon:yes stop_codon:yes gene_type:complete